MTITTVTVNDQDVVTYKFKLTRKGNRGIGEGRFDVAAATDVNFGDTVKVLTLGRLASVIEAQYIFNNDSRNKLHDRLHGIDHNIEYRDGYAEFNGTSSYIQVNHAAELNLHPGFGIVWRGRFYDEPNLSPGYVAVWDADTVDLGNTARGVRMSSTFSGPQKLTKVSIVVRRKDTSGAKVDGYIYLDVHSPTKGFKVNNMRRLISTFPDTKSTVTFTIPEIALEASDVIYIRADSQVAGQTLVVYGRNNGVWAYYAGSSGGTQAPDTFFPRFVIGDAGSREELMVYKSSHIFENGWGLVYERDGRLSALANGHRIKSQFGKIYADGRDHMVYFEASDAGVTNLWVDGIKVATGTSSGSTNTNFNMQIGRGTHIQDWFSNGVRSVEIYDEPLSDADRERLFANGYLASKLIFQGRVETIDRKTTYKTIACYDKSKLLQDTIIQSRSFVNTSISDIISAIITDNTDLVYERIGNVGSYQLDYTASGSIMSILQFLSAYAISTWNVTPDGKFQLRDVNVLGFEKTYQHGLNSRVHVTHVESEELVNVYRLRGAVTEVEVSRGPTVGEVAQIDVFFSGEDHLGQRWKSFYVLLPSEFVRVVRVTLNGVVSVHESQGNIGPNTYLLRGGRITIKGPRSINSSTPVLIQYIANQVLEVTATDARSVMRYGSRMKSDTFERISSAEELFRLGSEYVNHLANPYDVANVHKLDFDDVSVNANVRVVDSVRSIDKVMVVDQVEWEYPKGMTKIKVQDFGHVKYDLIRDVVDKVRDTREVEAVVDSSEQFKSGVYATKVNMSGTAELLSL